MSHRAVSVGQRIARVRKGSRSLETGLVWVEAYLPIDVEAFAEFSDLVSKGETAAELARRLPELTRRALTPIDSHGEAMLPDDVADLGRQFLELSRRMDVEHDEQARPTVAIVESFINGPEIESPHFWPGAWVTVFKVAKNSEEWAAIERGDLNAVSFQAWTTKRPITITREA
jgi:hypothetical protein